MKAIVISFNPGLTGEAVYFKGSDIEGDTHDGKFLIFASDRSQASLTNAAGEQFDIGIEQFEYAEGFEVPVLRILT